MKEFKDWEVIDIYLKNNENNYLEDTIDFYNKLKMQHHYFAKRKKNKNNHVILEEINSPLTFINGNWGSGKTFFISKFFDNFEKILKNELINEKENYFGNYIYINALDLVDDDKIILSFLYELSTKLNKLKRLSGKIGKVTLKALSKYSGIIGKVSEEIESEFFDKNEKEEKIIFPSKILIFIDNLERIGRDSNKVIKIVNKLKKLDNLLFIFVTNIRQLQFGYNDQKINSLSTSEYPIYKFIDLTPFNLKQDYKSILINKNRERIIIDQSELNIINGSLNNIDSEKVNSYQLTIRQFENWLKSSNFFKIDNKIDRLLKINEIDYVNIKSEFLKEYEEELNNYMSYLIEFINLYNEWKKSWTKAQFVKPQGYENYEVDYEGFLRRKVQNERLDRYVKNKKIEFKIYSGSYFVEISSTPNWNSIHNTLNLEQVKKLSLKSMEESVIANEKLKNFDDLYYLKIKKIIENYKIEKFVPLLLLNYNKQFENELNVLKEVESKIKQKINEVEVQFNSLNAKWIELLDDKKNLEEKAIEIENYDKYETEITKAKKLIQENPKTNVIEIETYKQAINTAKKEQDKIIEKYGNDVDENIESKILEIEKSINLITQEIKNNSLKKLPLEDLLNGLEIKEKEKILKNFEQKIDKMKSNLNEIFLINDNYKNNEKINMELLEKDKNLFKEEIVKSILKKK